jgi:hypothetical protein
MKRKSILSTLWLSALAFVMFGLSSCGGTTEDPLATIDIIFEPATLELKAGERGTIKFNVTSTENLQKINVTADGIGTVKTLTKDFTTRTTHTDQIEVVTTAAQAGKSFNFFVEVTDVKGGFKSRSVTVKVLDNTPPPPPPAGVNTFTVILMGAQENANGSFADLDAGRTFKISEAPASSALIDIGYYFSTAAGTGAVLASPSSSFLSGAFPSVGNWSKRNKTKIYTVTANAADFNGIGSNDGAKINTFVSAGSLLSEERITGLVADRVVGFETEAGKRGLILVKSVQGTTAGTITIDVKILK